MTFTGTCPPRARSLVPIIDADADADRKPRYASTWAGPRAALRRDTGHVDPDELGVGVGQRSALLPGQIGASVCSKSTSH
jgi:hypothetical protein